MKVELGSQTCAVPRCRLGTQQAWPRERRAPEVINYNGCMVIMTCERERTWGQEKRRAAAGASSHMLWTMLATALTERHAHLIGWHAGGAGGVVGNVVCLITYGQLGVFGVLHTVK